MTRAVLDTNVIVSRIIKGNSPLGRILALLFKGRFTSITSAPLMMEISRVLDYPKVRNKYHVSPEVSENILVSLALLSEIVPTPAVPRTSRDPEDDPLLACAAHGRANFIVTGDEALLVLEEFRGIPIIAPEGFLKHLGPRERRNLTPSGRHSKL